MHRYLTMIYTNNLELHDKLSIKSHRRPPRSDVTQKSSADASAGDFAFLAFMFLSELCDDQWLLYGTLSYRTPHHETLHPSSYFHTERAFGVHQCVNFPDRIGYRTPYFIDAGVALMSIMIGSLITKLLRASLHLAIRPTTLVASVGSALLARQRYRDGVEFRHPNFHPLISSDIHETP
ncbi:hypothetical protein [Burkholderia diffusa]|uniref:hypothetical protein n=1 Tax=Burkholderia diffusa TaxID=488732 RepID=UPI0012D8EB85|nr:hypothetical protein [Burkholderia diffusa]